MYELSSASAENTQKVANIVTFLRLQFSERVREKGD